eukprot:Gb_14092 [translate_table: standard]
MSIGSIPLKWGVALPLGKWKYWIPVTLAQHICCEVWQPLEKVNWIDSTMRREKKAHEKVKLKPYGISLKKVLIMPNEGGVPLEEVKSEQGVQINREYMVFYTSQEGEVAKRPNSQH